MAEMLTDSMRHVDSAAFATPAAIRIPRPLRDLLRGSGGDLGDACRTAWAAAAADPGRWVRIDPRLLVDPSERNAVAALALLASPGHLDMRVCYPGDAFAIARGRRVVFVGPPLPETAINAAAGEPLARTVDAPFLRDPAIVVQRAIGRLGGTAVDFRCRCPSHLVRLPPADA